MNCHRIHLAGLESMVCFQSDYTKSLNLGRSFSRDGGAQGVGHFKPAALLGYACIAPRLLKFSLI